MSGRAWKRLWRQPSLVRPSTLGVLICLQFNSLWGTGLREAHAETESSEQSVLTNVDLQVTPTSCVALHRGQVCFQRLQLRWKNPEGHRLCLFSQKQDDALYCSALSPVEYRYEYRSEESEAFHLRKVDSDEVLARVTVTTAWVYRTGKRSSSGWRLF